MKSINIAYWIITVLFAGFIIASSVGNVMSNAESVNIFKQLGYPAYLLPFLGVAKISGGIVLLIPGLVRLKEWAYAGLAFDMLGAAYSLFSVGMLVGVAPVMFVVLFALLFTSYFLHHKRLQAKAAL